MVSTSWVGNQSSVTPPQLEPTCFVAGTLITTANGPRRVEDIVAGDLVLTADKGLVAVQIAHCRALPTQYLRSHPNHKPIRIREGALGQGLPSRDLVVSPQHRMVIGSDIARRMFGHQEILVPACQLVGHPGITRVAGENPVEYCHILLDHHAIVFAEGGSCEKLFKDQQVHENLSPREIRIIRATLSASAEQLMAQARPFVRWPRLKRLLERHARNNKPLLDQDFDTATIGRTRHA